MYLVSPKPIVFNRLLSHYNAYVYGVPIPRALSRDVSQSYSS